MPGLALLHPLRGLLVAVVFGTSATALGNPEPTNTRRYLTLGAARVLAARPKPCDAVAATDGVEAWNNLGWKHVRESDTGRRCVRLAQGLTRVMQDPEKILEWFPSEVVEEHRATSTTPRAAGSVDALTLAERTLIARATLRTGNATAAYEQFFAIAQVLPIVQWHVLSVHDFAVSAAHTGRFDVAVTCYHRLLSVASWLPERMKIDVLLEASAALLHGSTPAASEVLNHLADLDDQALGPDQHAVRVALGLAAKSILEPNAALTLPNIGAHAGVHSTHRLTDEDTRFVQALASYAATSQLPSSGDGAPSFSLPAYAAIFSRLKGP